MSLKQQLDDAASPLRTWFEGRLPHVGAAKLAFREALSGATTVLPVPGEEPIPWSVIGHAVSALCLWQVGPEPEGWLGGRHVMDLLGYGFAPGVVEGLHGLAEQPPGDLGADVAARVAWFGGLNDRARRSPRGSDDLIPYQDATTLEALLARVPDRWAADVAAVVAASEPILAGHAGPGTVVAPVFAGSGRVGGADADYITGDGLLVDVKCTKSVGWRSRDLHQLVSYALLDWDDEFSIDAVALLMARQGRLVAWNLEDLLAKMADEPVQAADVREDLRTVLQR